MNDICNVLELLYTIMYADDTSVITTGNDLKRLIQSVNSELCLLNTWLKANKLSLNVNKTYYLVFHRARIKIDNDTSVRMNDSIINSASHLKNSKLNWIPHITLPYLTRVPYHVDVGCYLTIQTKLLYLLSGGSVLLASFLSSFAGTSGRFPSGGP